MTDDFDEHCRDAEQVVNDDSFAAAAQRLVDEIHPILVAAAAEGIAGDQDQSENLIRTVANRLHEQERDFLNYVVCSLLWPDAFDEARKIMAGFQTDFALHFGKTITSVDVARAVVEEPTVALQAICPDPDMHKLTYRGGDVVAWWRRWRGKDGGTAGFCPQCKGKVVLGRG